jgi:hypothetical protein
MALVCHPKCTKQTFSETRHCYDGVNEASIPYEIRIREPLRKGYQLRRGSVHSVAARRPASLSRKVTGEYYNRDNYNRETYDGILDEVPSVKDRRRRGPCPRRCLVVITGQRYRGPNDDEDSARLTLAYLSDLIRHEEASSAQAQAVDSPACHHDDHI